MFLDKNNCILYYMYYISTFGRYYISCFSAIYKITQKHIFQDFIAGLLIISYSPRYISFYLLLFKILFEPLNSFNRNNFFVLNNSKDI